MSYNKALAEKQWRAWKEAEERKLRKLGVDEDTIQRLHTYDWEEFKRERRYREWIDKGMPGMEPEIPNPNMEIPIEDVESLLDNIENPDLFRVISNESRPTLEIILLKSEGFSTEEICQKLHITDSTYYNRIKHLKEKIKKFFSCHD